MNIAKELARQAKEKGICDEWYKRLVTLESYDAMAEMYLKGIDFCLKNEYPSNDFIKENFGDVALRHGIFVDAELNVRNASKCVCLGGCCGRVVVDGYNAGEVFVKHDSEVTIIAGDNAFVMVDVFDNAAIKVQASGRARVCVNRYGGTVEHTMENNSIVKIKEKHQKTY